MADSPWTRPAPGAAVPAGWRGGPVARTPSGLFPSGPPRPSYREPHPVRAGAFLVGLAAGALWLLLFGLLGADLGGYAWWTVLGGALAWLASWVMVRFGDRGVGAGLSISTAAAWSIAAMAVAVRWATAGDWPLW